MTKEQIELLFGKDFNIDELFQRLDKDESGDVSIGNLNFVFCQIRLVRHCASRREEKSPKSVCVAILCEHIIIRTPESGANSQISD